MSDTTTMNQTGQGISRRSFLAGAGVAALGVGATAALSGCSPSKSSAADSDGSSSASGTSEEWYGSPQDLSSFTFDEEVDVEILICGAGHAGLSASLAAADTGADTMVIERNATHGTMREFWGCIGATCQTEAGVQMDPNAVANELMRYASNRADQRLINLWARESGETVDWMMTHLEPEGFSIVAETDIGDGYHGIYPIYPVQTNVQVPLEEGQQPGPDSFSVVPETVANLAAEAGVEFRYSTELVQCIVEDGKVTGAVAKDTANDKTIRINTSKGVLITTGGYEGNTDLVNTLQPWTLKVMALNSGSPSNDGTGLKAGIWAGGHKDDCTAYMLFDRGTVLPTEEPGPDTSGQMLWQGSQPWLKVDFNGERFCNESVPYDFGIHAASLHKGAGWVSLWDANWKDNVVAFHTQGCSRIDKSPTQGNTQIFTFESIEAINQQLLEQGYIQQADTIEELAEKLNIPADNLVATVNRYNEMAEAGVDDDFGKPAKDLIALTTPPYYGARQGAAGYCTLDGLRINPDCQVVDEEDEPIEGLWAAGNVSGGFFANNYPELIFGCACGRSMTEARHAILNMVGEK